MILFPNNFIGGVITDQAEADEDTALKERVALAVGKYMSTSINVNQVWSLHVKKNYYHR